MEDCRFCNLVLDQKCPKTNNLSAQLIQYHYLDEFYFYFNKPINEILGNSRTPEAIRFRDVQYLVDDTEDNLRKYYEGDYAKMKLKRLINTFSEDRMIFNFNFHACWKVFLDRDYVIEKMRRMDRSSAKRKNGPKYPLRNGNILEELRKEDNGDYEGLESEIFDIYEPEFDSETNSVSQSRVSEKKRARKAN